MKLLLTDAVSHIGRALAHQLEFESHSLAVPECLDWSDRKAVEQYVSHVKPDLVVNTVGWAELPSASEQSYMLASARSLSHVCAAADIPVVHLSSYRVFGGEVKSEYAFNDRPSPLGEEGRAFWDAETLFEQAGGRWIGLRLGWQIEAYNDNYLTQLLEALTAGEEVLVSTRHRVAPTDMLDSVRVIVAVIRQVLTGADNWGIMQYCSEDACTEAEFAGYVADILQDLQVLSGSVVDVDGAGVKWLKSPLSTVLKNVRLREAFGVQSRSWRTALKPMIRFWLERQRQANQHCILR